MPDTQFDLIVIGAGPGGYVAAIRGAQLGLKTALVEKWKTLGGTCLNIGCIPSKALLHSTEHLQFAKREAAKHGIRFGEVSVDLAAMQSRKDGVVKALTGGVYTLVQKNGITRFEGTGTVTAQGKVSVSSADGQTTGLTGKHIILATGSVSAELPNVKIDGETVIGSTEALAFNEAPKKLLVIGAGAIGLELGSVWNRLGSEVTVIEFLPRIALGFDDELAEGLLKSLQREGMTFHLETRVSTVAVKNGRAIAKATKAGEELTFEADKVLLAVGRKPFLDKAVVPEAGLALDERGRVKIDAHFRTSIPGLYAIGDIVAGPMLAHKAEEEGVASAEIIAGRAGHVNYAVIPNVVYTHPELAGVGLTEQQARDQKIDVHVGRFSMRANGRALAAGNTDGSVKMIADVKTDRLLGAHVLAANASELIAEAVMLMEFSGSAEDFGRTVHAHPTMSEALKEAALAVDKRAIHALK